MPEVIGLYYVVQTASRAVDGDLLPLYIRVDSEDEALEKARVDLRDDAYGGTAGVVRVMSDGSLVSVEFSAADVEGPVGAHA